MGNSQICEMRNVASICIEFEKKFRFDSAKEKQVILLNGFVICKRMLTSTIAHSMSRCPGS